MTTGHSFSLRVPPSWQEIDLAPRTRDASARDFVLRRLEDQPALYRYRTEITRNVRNLARRAHDAGALYVAVFAESADESVVPGSIMVTLLPHPPGSAGDADPFDAVVDQLREIPQPEGDGEWRSLTSVEVAGHGTAARTYGVEEVEGDGAIVIWNVLMRTFVPVPDGVLLVVCASPALDLAEPLLELFSIVSDTLEITTTEVA